MSIDRKTFFAYARKAPFGNRLTQQQVDGTTCILDAYAATGCTDLRWLAYILATAFHETGGRMVPVREGFAKNDAGARKVVANRAYGVPDKATGHVYYGRGHVQLTWAKNYRTMGDALGIDLYDHPDLALDPKVSANILVEGMIDGQTGRGDFTRYALDDFFSNTTEDPVGARKIVNGTDKAHLIAGYYKQFKEALLAADTATPLPTDVKEADAQPDGTPLSRDTTVIGAVTSVLGAGGAGFLGSIDNPWAFAAFGVAALLVGIGVILFLTGRLKIRREAGV